ncbi:MAG: hypothetical protein ACFE75_13335, partial [Candidatus Hodarchaeota archaeon]
MSRSESVLYPPGEILNPIIGKSDYEYIILWMLNNNDTCIWSDFTAKISESTLSGHLRKLKNKGFIKKPERNHYRITLQGKERFNELTYDRKLGKRRLKYPPKAILRRRNYDHWILWMLYNNYSCKWSDFKQEPLSINQSSLSNNLNMLIENGFITRENKEYVISPVGKTEYFSILKQYDLDRQSILEQESKRIEEITEKTRDFFYRYEIEDDELKFRYLDYILKLNYSKVDSMLKNEEDFNKILLFLSMNHPNQYPDYISTEDFSLKYVIDETTLNYYIREIIDNQFFQIKFFKIEDKQNRIFYFQKGEPLEKILNAIVEKYITKFTYLNKFQDNPIIDINLLLENIIEEICGNLFRDNLKVALKAFLPDYIKYLAYKIEAETKLVDREAKLEGFVWQNIFEEFQKFEPSSQKVGAIDDEGFYAISKFFDVLDIVKFTKLNFLRSKEVQDTYNPKGHEIFKKIGTLLNKDKIVKAKTLFESIDDQLTDLNKLILRDIITTAENNLKDSIKITTEIIDKYPNEFIGYLLQSITWFLMDNYEESLEIINNALEITPNVLLNCQKTQILIRMYREDKALEIIEENLTKYPDNPILLRLKYCVYITHWISLVKDYNKPLGIINRLTNLNPNDQELLLLKCIYYCEVNKYKEAKRLITKKFEFNNFKKNPRIDTIAYYILAYSYLARGKFDKSLETANLVLTLYPDYPISFLTKALVIGYNLIHRFTFKVPNIDTFTDLIKLALSFDPIKYNKTRYLQLQALILNALGRYDDSIKSIDNAIELVPSLIPLYATKTYLLIISKREGEALNLIGELLKSYP